MITDLLCHGGFLLTVPYCQVLQNESTTDILLLFVHAFKYILLIYDNKLGLYYLFIYILIKNESFKPNDNGMPTVSRQCDTVVYLRDFNISILLGQ